MSHSDDALRRHGEAAPARADHAAPRTAHKRPESAGAELRLAALAYAEGRLRESASHALAAAETPPNDADLVCRIALTLLQLGEAVAARRCLAHPAVAACRSDATLARFAMAQQMLGDQLGSLALLERASRVGADSAGLRYARGVQLMFVGRGEEAEGELNACLQIDPTHGRAAYVRATLRKQTPEDNHVDDVRARLRRMSGGGDAQAALEYALYRELDDLDDTEAAWAALARGSAMMAALSRFDAAGESRIVDGLIRAVGAFESAAEQPPIGAQPIFIVGMPRSGTTVLERMLGNHAQIAPAGELEDFARALRWGADRKSAQPVNDAILQRVPHLDFAAIGQRYLAQTQWRAGGKRYYIDKLPLNWMQVGFICRALPHARILHLVRDPMGTCYSNLRALFGAGYAYSYKAATLAAHHRNYRRTMEHWHRVLPGRILDVSYAQLVTAPADAMHTMLAHCGVDYSTDCTQPERNLAPVTTLSNQQVRAPIHQRGLCEWWRYERWLGPLADALLTP